MISLALDYLNLAGTKWSDEKSHRYFCGSCSREFPSLTEMEKHWIDIGIESKSKAVAIIKSAIKCVEKEYSEVADNYNWGVRGKEKSQLKFLRRLLEFVKELDKPLKMDCEKLE